MLIYRYAFRTWKLTLEDYQYYQLQSLGAKKEKTYMAEQW